MLTTSTGYWRDVGTIDSLWEANMEVLDPENSGIDIFDEKWKIYSRNPVLPAQKIGPRALVQDSLVTEGCQIYGCVKHSVLSAGIVVEEGATVEDAVLMDASWSRQAQWSSAASSLRTSWWAQVPRSAATAPSHMSAPV